jgi:peptidyl-prolyl cis-trans isomerase D
VHQVVLADQAEAEAAARLAREAGFDALLAERGMSRADAALGALTPRDLPGARGEAAFAAEAPGIVGPTQTPGGWAVLEVGDFQPEQVTPFEAVREALARELVGNAGLAEADRLAEEIADLRAAGATLEEAARELGLTLDGVQGLSREEAASREDLPDGFAEEAFAAAEGEERRLLRTPEGGWLALRVDAVEPTRPAELEEARAAVAADWRAERRRNALAETAAEAAARLEAGEDPAAVAAAFSGEAVEIGPISRDAEAPRIGAEARATLFSAQPGAVAVTVLDDEAVIARLAEVREPEGIDQQVALFRQALAQSVAEDQLQYLGYALERAAGVSLNPQTVEAAVSQVGG